MIKLIGLWFSLFFITSSSFLWMGQIFFLFFLCLIFLLYFCGRVTRGSFSRIFFFLDSLSISLLLLTFWVRGLILIRRQRILLKSNDRKIFLHVNGLMVLLLWILFLVTNFFLFYAFFELILVPTVLMILGWGIQPDRLNASFYFSIYTIFRSLPFLGFLIRFFKEGGSNFFPFFLENSNLKWGNFFLVRAFLVKLPIYGVHLWLPKAHVEAPTGGSIFLAAILLKIGIYGFFRFLRWELGGVRWIRSIVLALSLVGGTLVSFLCLTQFDIKSLVAYSSVSHMALVLRGVFSLNGLGWRGAFLTCLAHGFASSGFFALVTFIYEGSSRRSLVFNKGLLLGYPLTCLFLFVNNMINIAAPPTLNLMGEIFLYFRIFSFRKILLPPLFFISTLTVGYNLIFYTRMAAGKRGNQLNVSFPLTGPQFFSLVGHRIPCFLTIILCRRFYFF